MKAGIRIVVAVLAVAGVAVQAQSLGEIAKKAAAAKKPEPDAKAKPEAAVDPTKKPAKVYTDKDLRPEPGSVAPMSLAPVTVSADPKTRDALASLRAVQSVLDGGANASEFKKYYLEARVKVDALPATPDAAPLRAIADLYADAVTLGIAYQTTELRETELSALKSKYLGETEVMKYLNALPTDGMTVRHSRFKNEESAINVRAAQQVLLVLAVARLSAIKVL